MSTSEAHQVIDLAIRLQQEVPSEGIESDQIDKIVAALNLVNDRSLNSPFDATIASADDCKAFTSLSAYAGLLIKHCTVQGDHLLESYLRYLQADINLELIKYRKTLLESAEQSVSQTPMADASERLPTDDNNVGLRLRLVR